MKTLRYLIHPNKMVDLEDRSLFEHRIPTELFGANGFHIWRVPYRSGCRRENGQRYDTYSGVRYALVKDRATNEDGVIIGEMLLVTHALDRRSPLIQEWMERIKNYSIEDWVYAHSLTAATPTPATPKTQPTRLAEG